MADLDFTHKHPEYLADVHRWEMGWDFYRGGRYVLQPQRNVSVHMGGDQGFSVKDSAADGKEGGKAEGRASYSALPGYAPHPSRSYLHKHPREHIDEFSSRCNQSIHLCLQRSITDIYADTVLSVGPAGRRGNGMSAGESAFWDMYHSDVDMCGTSIDAFVRRVVVLGLVMGRSGALTDRPMLEGPLPSLEAQRQAGDRPYSVAVKATEAVDWTLDEFGKLRWMQLESRALDSRPPGVAHKLPPRVETIYGTSNWARYRENLGTGPHESSWHLSESGIYPSTLTEPPISWFFGGRREGPSTLSTDGLLSDLVDADRSLLNQTSLLLEQIYGQVFAVLCLPVAEGAPVPQGLNIGINRFLGFNSGNGTPTYLQVNPEVLAVQWKLIQETISTYRQLKNVGRGRAEFSKEERSAASMSLESADKHTAVAALAEKVEAFDHQLHRHVAAWKGWDPADAPKANYNRTISLHSLREQIGNVIQLKQLGLKKAVLEKLTSPVYVRALKEFGVEADDIEQAAGELLDDMHLAGDAPTPKEIATSDE